MSDNNKTASKEFSLMETFLSRMFKEAIDKKDNEPFSSFCITVDNTATDKAFVNMCIPKQGSGIFVQTLANAISMNPILGEIFGMALAKALLQNKTTMITSDILYQVTCDHCGKTLPNSNGGHWFKTQDEAVGTARQYGWHLYNEKHLCTNCYKSVKGKR